MADYSKIGGNCVKTTLRFVFCWHQFYTSVTPDTTKHVLCHLYSDTRHVQPLTACFS